MSAFGTKPATESFGDFQPDERKTLRDSLPDTCHLSVRASSSGAADLRGLFSALLWIVCIRRGLLAMPPNQSFFGAKPTLRVQDIRRRAASLTACRPFKEYAVTHVDVMESVLSALEQSFLLNAKNRAAMENQEWEREGDFETFNGVVMAQRMTARGNFIKFEHAATHFLGSKIGECFKTGVSGYTRIR